MLHSSRRDALKAISGGFGYMALAGMLAESSASSVMAGEKKANPLAPKAPHHAPKAKRLIFLSMRGGPSHVDTFDYKPGLAKDDGKSQGAAAKKGKKRKGGRKLMKSPWEFKQHGESGLPISDLFPNLAQHADDLCLINSMYADIPNHPQAYLQLHTGDFRFVRPSVGAWTLYGLGTESQDLPGFITIKPEANIGGAQNYGSAFLPAVYQGTRVGQQGRPLTNVEIGNLKNSNLTRELQRDQIDLIQEMNKELLAKNQQNSELEGIIESYELAFRMQSEVPRLMNLKTESQATLDSYGINEKSSDDFGRQCLMARRFAEAGVRYIELCHGNWDQHNKLRDNLGKNCAAIDKPIAGLIADLKQRDMLDETLIVWGGEFGRTPHVKQNDGRDHNATGFSMWMAGGGIKGGMRYGSTDEHGIKAVENRVHFHDLHATMLWMLGLDHKKLTYRYAGRDFRLTDVYGKVLKDIMV